ncbi:MAG TPA: response regulator [Gemmatimonadaceae bacterium]|nr:response regulator [Gemmatimonadaceae bacterium]
MRVLFVDDEARILDGLQRMLRPLRDRWEMVFAPGGPAALQVLEHGPFDVIVSDMRMPEVDGAALLRHVRETTPETVRIVLSGQTDAATATRTVRVAHQFLTKPCEADVLRRVVERSCALQALLADAALRQAVGGVDVLPSVPRVYAALEAASARADSTVEEIAAIVEQDPALCAKVLQIVNSSFFGLSRPVTRIAQAVSYLGVDVLRALVLSHELARVAGPEIAAPDFSLSAHQSRALLTAQLARAIMRTEARHLADDAFMAGMLHDIGELLLASRAPARWRELRAAMTASGESLADVERRLGGATHATVGAYLLGLWGLPFHIVEAVAHHHTPSSVVGPTGQVDVLTAVHVASALVAGAEATGPAAPGGAAPALDLAYLAAIPCADRIDGWRALAQDLLHQTAEDR